MKYKTVKKVTSF